MDMLNISDLQVSIDGKAGGGLHHRPGFSLCENRGLAPALEEELDRAIQESGKGL